MLKVHPVPDVTYNVFGGTLNLAQFNLRYIRLKFQVRSSMDLISQLLCWRPESMEVLIGEEELGSRGIIIQF